MIGAVVEIQMEKRSALVVLVLLTGVVGLALFATVLIKSMTVNSKQRNDAWVECELAALPPGHLMRCGWASIYRRTTGEKNAVGAYINLLDDPYSKSSKQPESAKNKWRSESEEFFIFLPWAPHRGCPVELKPAGRNYPAWKPDEIAVLLKSPYFLERCEGRTWDASGRLYGRKGYPPEYNLTVPIVSWVSKNRVLVLRRRTWPE